MAAASANDVTVIVALIGLIGVALTSFRATFNDQRHHRREVLLIPSRDFARVALDAMAQLRHITPPKLKPNGRRPHRNEDLLTDRDERQARIARCDDAIDVVRRTRADMRLVFRPDSLAAEMAREVLENLRLCLESAQDFYFYFDQKTEDPQSWRESDRANALIQDYKQYRANVYRSLDSLFANVSDRLAKPRWGRTYEQNRLAPPQGAEITPIAVQDQSTVTLSAATASEELPGGQ